MRTRTSPRNQERLWKTLGGKAEKPEPAPPSACCFNCAFYGSRNGRDRAKCAKTGAVVYGITKGEPCYTGEDKVKKADVILGKRYLAKVSGKIVTVVPYYRTVDRGWFATNCATGREIRIKTAARLREIGEEGNRG